MLLQKNKAVDRLIEALGDGLSFSDTRESFSPMYSDIGLGFTDNGGISCIFLHYNRRTSNVGSPFLRLGEAILRSEKTALGVKQYFGKGSAEYAFYDRNSWVVECSVAESFDLCSFSGAGMSQVRCIFRGEDIKLFTGYLPSVDPRDPDPFFPVIIGIRLVQGKYMDGDGIKMPVRVQADGSGKIIAAFTANMLDVSGEKAIELLLSAPECAACCRELTYGWIASAIGDLDCFTGNEREDAALAIAIYSLISNSCMAPGILSGRISCFPNRGHYCSHYIWDSCFQNLALEYMNPRLAEDSLLLLTENLRIDGKMAQFLCPTWIRPLEAQSPLAGWAGLRLVKKKNDVKLAEKLLDPLWKNIQWWLTYRMTVYGIICSYNPLDTGWDDTPRYDHGPVLPCDLNTYLLLQIRACEELARMTGRKEQEREAGELAVKFASDMVRVLYDDKENIFKDVLLATGRRIPIKTPACFLPLLADVPLKNELACDMIRKYLLDPGKFFGKVPFPVIAYDETCYDPAKWWRGPTWIPIAYFMLEVLEKYGFEKEYSEAVKRLYEMLVNDGKASELFNSQTGEGIGSQQYGWTASVLLKLRLIAMERERER